MTLFVLFALLASTVEGHLIGLGCEKPSKNAILKSCKESPIYEYGKGCYISNSLCMDVCKGRCIAEDYTRSCQLIYECEWHILPFENTTGTDDKVVTGTTETDLKEKEGTTGTTGTDMKEEEGTVQDYILLILLLIVIVLTVVIVLVYLKKIKTNNGEQQSMHDVHIEMNAINP